MDRVSQQKSSPSPPVAGIIEGKYPLCTAARGRVQSLQPWCKPEPCGAAQGRRSPETPFRGTVRLHTAFQKRMENPRFIASAAAAVCALTVVVAGHVPAGVNIALNEVPYRLGIMSRKGSSSTGGASSGIMTGTPSWAQRTVIVTAPSRGCHLITREVERQMPELKQFKVGMANVFLKHTSASITLNENADPDVRTDMEAALNEIVPVKWHREMFTHTLEGPDDMTGHVKSTLVGASVDIPVTNGKLALGTWQGLYLCEHRDIGGFGGGHARNITVTVQGLAKDT